MLPGDCRFPAGIIHRGDGFVPLTAIASFDQGSYWCGAMDKRIIAGTGANELLQGLAVEEARHAARPPALPHGCLSAPLLRRSSSHFGANPYLDLPFPRFPLTPIDRAAPGKMKRAFRMCEAAGPP